MQKRKPIFLTGGGTLGSVTPLLGIYEAWRKKDPEQEFIWIGTPGGPERELVEKAGLPFHFILAPKAFRYITWRWLLFPFFFLWSFGQSAWLLVRYRPSWLISAGAYVSVPLAWLAPLFGARTAIHQLDASVGLANRLMAPVVSLLTATWPFASEQFPHKDVHVVGALVSDTHLEARSRAEALEYFDLDPHRPTVLVLGGGGGSLAINRVMEEVADTLVGEVNVLHATGKGKPVFSSRRPPEHYYATELFLENFGDAFALADVVVTRAGLGTMAELVREKKAAILIPLPHSAQEANARAAEEKGAALVLFERDMTGGRLLEMIHSALTPDLRHRLEERVASLFPAHGGADQIVKLIQNKDPR